MKSKLILRALTKYLAGLLMVGALLFLPAGTLLYRNGWLFIALLFLSIPLVLGSWYAFAIFLLYPLLLIKRIKNEEAVLTDGLPGYTEYKKKVKYRMIPLVW